MSNLFNRASFCADLAIAKRHWMKKRRAIRSRDVESLERRVLLAANYTVTDLGTLDGPFAEAYGMNNLGQVVGWSTTSAKEFRRIAFRTEPNAPINPATDNLGTLGGYESRANGINNTGEVVGQSHGTSGSGYWRGFRTKPNAAINPSTDDLGLDDGVVATGINDSGQVAGDRFGVPFRTESNASINLATDDLRTLLPVNSVGSASGINSSGQVIGYINDTQGSIGAFRTGANSAINVTTDLLALQRYVCR